MSAAAAACVDVTTVPFTVRAAFLADKRDQVLPAAAKADLVNHMHWPRALVLACTSSSLPTKEQYVKDRLALMKAAFALGGECLFPYYPFQLLLAEEAVKGKPEDQVAFVTALLLHLTADLRGPIAKAEELTAAELDSKMRDAFLVMLGTEPDVAEITEEVELTMTKALRNIDYFNPLHTPGLFPADTDDQTRKKQLLALSVYYNHQQENEEKLAEWQDLCMAICVRYTGRK